MKKKIFFSIIGILIFAAAAAAVYYFWPQKQKAAPLNKPDKIQTELMERGVRLHKEKYYTPFVTVYEKMMKELPDNPDLKKKLAFAYFGVGKYREAKPLLDEVAKTPLADAETFYELGFIARGEGKDAEAKKYFEEALAKNPEHPGAKKMMGKE